MPKAHEKSSSSASNQGVILHDSLPNGRASATISVSPVSVIAKDYGELCIEFPLNNLKLQWGGTNNQLLFLTHPSKPDWTILTREHALLIKLKDIGNPHISQQISALRKNTVKAALRFLLMAAVFALLLWGSLLLWRPLVASCAHYIPFSWERKLGEAVFVGVQQQTKVIADEELAKDFKALLEPLTSAVGPIGKDLEFYLAKSDTLNAFAIPGGKIVVNSKTILEAGRLEELYGVLAHEISHVSERHTARQIITVFGIYTVVDLVLGSGLGTVAAVTQGASYLLQQGFSREQERDADLHALQYLRAAQIDPHGMIEFFQRIEKEYSKDNPLGGLERSVAFFSTHPATSDRIEEIKALIASEPTLTYRSFDTEVFNAFKKKLRTYLEMH